MKIILEDSIRKQGDETTIEFLELWKELSISTLNKHLPVCIRDLKDHPHYKHIDTEFHSTNPYPENKPVSLAIWSSHYPNLDDVLITHEIGHGILVLQGFKTILERSLGININGLIRQLGDHPVIHSIQKQYGHNPQILRDPRARKSINFVRKKPIPWPESETLMAMYLADDVYSCSKTISKRILKLSSRYHPTLHDKIERIIQCMNKHDLMDIEENLQCRFEIISELNISGKWVIQDDLQDLLAVM